MSSYTNVRGPRTNVHALSGIRTRDLVYERSRLLPQTARQQDWQENLFVQSQEQILVIVERENLASRVALRRIASCV
jgi:hypothetical protein